MNSTNPNQSVFMSFLKTPWTSRSYLLCLIIFHLLDIYNDQWSYTHLSSNFFSTILGYEPWRLFINFVYEPNTIILVLIVLHMYYYLPKLERQNGTVIAFYEVVTIGFLVHFFTLCYEAAIYLLNDMEYIDNWKLTYNVGAGGAFVNIILKFLWFNTKEPNKFFTKRAVLAYLYPVVFILLGSKLCNQVRIDMIIGYVLGMIECIVFRGGMIFYTDDTYTKKQTVVNFLRLNRIPLCFYHNVNHEKIVPNRMGVVEASQFYILKSYIPAQSNNQLNEVEMETERGSFRRANGMVSDDLSEEAKGEKWEQTEQITEDD